MEVSSEIRLFVRAASGRQRSVSVTTRCDGVFGLRNRVLVRSAYSNISSDLEKSSRERKAKIINVETTRIFKWWDYAVFAILTLTALGTGFYFFRYWLTLEAWNSDPIALSFLTLLLAVQVAFWLFSWCLLPGMRRPIPVPAQLGWSVGVLTTFVPDAESLEMLRHTVQALVAMDYPHDTWVLDEGDDPRVKALCIRLGAHHFSRKHLPHYQTEEGIFKSRTKYGNVNAWLHEIGFDRYDIISAFDPDHVPKPSFLGRVLGYFEDEQIGYVQAAQVYYNQAASFIARGAAEETYAYYSTIQMASYSLGYPIVTGCHNTHRTRALREIDGFAAHDADDLLITLQYRVSGWQGVYVPEVLAVGLTPTDWTGYLRQQRRWARSVMNIKFRVFPRLAKRLPFRTRAISMLHGLSYLGEAMLPFFALLLLVYLLVFSQVPVLGYLFVPQLFGFLIVLQLNDFFRQRFFLQPREEWGLHWRAGLMRYAKWPYCLLALADVVSNRTIPYILTAKQDTQQSRNTVLWPHFLTTCALALAWLTGFTLHHQPDVVLRIWTVVMMAVSLGLFATQFRRFPAPFDSDLLLGRTPEVERGLK